MDEVWENRPMADDMLDIEIKYGQLAIGLHSWSWSPEEQRFSTGVSSEVLVSFRKRLCLVRDLGGSCVGSSCNSAHDFASVVHFGTVAAVDITGIETGVVYFPWSLGQGFGGSIQSGSYQQIL